MQIVEKSDNKIVFTANISESLANAVRRSMGLIPTLAIDELEIAKNDSALYDETFAHRVGLVPLKMPKDIKDEEIKLKIKKKGPGYVYSKDITGDAEIVYSEIPLTLLKDNQEVEAVCIARLGKGKDHAKFMPGFMTYRNSCEITMPKKYKSLISKSFPENEIKDKGENIIIKDNKAKSLIDFCEGLCKKDKEKYETKDSEELVISIESFGQIPVNDLFKQSVEALKAELKALSF